MKKYYSLLGCVGLLAAGPVAPAAQGQVTLSGPATLCMGAGGLVTMPSYLTVGPGATLAAMQATHEPCYLDTQRPTELLFFQRLGFRLMGQCPAGLEAGAPVNWGLMREGRA